MKGEAFLLSSSQLHLRGFKIKQSMLEVRGNREGERRKDKVKQSEQESGTKSWTKSC